MPAVFANVAEDRRHRSIRMSIHPDRKESNPVTTDAAHAGVPGWGRPLFDSAAHHPEIAVVVLAVATLLVQYLPYFLLPGLAVVDRRFLGKLLISGLAVALIAALNGWRQTGLSASAGAGPRWKAALPLLLLVILSALASNFEVNGPGQVLYASAYALAIGFSEEAIFRGLFLQFLLPRGATRAVVLSSLVFGLMHLANLMVGADLTGTLTQVIYATLIGICFAGVRLYIGSLWPLIIIHALVDFFPKLALAGVSVGSVDLVSAVIVIGIQVPFALYGAWLLRRHRRETMGHPSPASLDTHKA